MNKAFFVVATSILLSVPALAYADDTPLPPEPSWRLGILPVVGGGIAKLTSTGPFQGFVGTSVAGGEIDFTVARLGVFVRGLFLSSGPDGRWTAPTLAVGPTYRFFDRDKPIALVGRVGLEYERWKASTGGCDVYLFVPNGCVDIAPPPGAGGVAIAAPRSDTFADTLGVTAGARLELPVGSSFFLGLDAELAAVGALESGYPGGVFEMRLAVMFGLKHVRVATPASLEEEERRSRGPRGIPQ